MLKDVVLLCQTTHKSNVAKYTSDFVMLPTYTYPEISTAKRLLSKADFTLHHMKQQRH